MPRKFYQILSISLPCLYFILYLLLEYGEKSEFLLKFPMLALLFYFIKPIVALLTFFFGIYFFKAKIKSGRNGIAPHSLIFLGTLFIIISFIPPFMGYYALHNMTTQPYTTKKIEAFKNFVLNSKYDVKIRKEISGIIYIQSGELVNYLNENGKKVVYSPTNSDKEKRQKQLQLKSKIECTQLLIKQSFLYHLGLLFIFLIVFFIVIKIKPPTLMVE